MLIIFVHFKFKTNEKTLCLFSAILIALTSCCNNDDNSVSLIMPKQRINVGSKGVSHLLTFYKTEIKSLVLQIMTVLH
jgi:hypothetical protein